MRINNVGALRAAAKELIKLGLLAYAKSATLILEAGRGLNELVAEARQELEAESSSEWSTAAPYIDKSHFPDLQANTFQVASDRLIAWHHYLSESPTHPPNACVICAYRQGSQSWPAVVGWVEEAGFTVCKVTGKVLEIHRNPGHDENDLYHLVSGRGDWV